MALNSPRFRNEPKFQQIDGGGSSLRSGARGRTVHLLQMALIDAGIALPKSTTSQHYSPDGIFGTETVDAVKAFQRQNPPLKDDGVVGPMTLRALDARHPRFTHRVSLHFRSLSLSDVPFDTMLASAEIAYAQYGIEIRFASGESLGLSEAEQQQFNTVQQNCVWDVGGGEFERLHQLGSPVPTNDIGVFIVNAFQENNVLGCGGHATGRPACAVTHNCSRWDPAHEVGHVLLTSSFAPTHSDDNRNLMFAFSSNGGTPLALTEKQLVQMKASAVCRVI